MSNIFIKPGSRLTTEEILEIDEAKNREWGIPPMRLNDIETSIFFLLRDEQNYLLALGQTSIIPPLEFNKEVFNILGVGGIIANIKGKGYGTELVHGIIEYLNKNNKTGVGFCDDKLGDFYNKCGFVVVKDLAKRFVYYENGKKIINTNEKNVFYHESRDNFLKKVLENPDMEVILSHEPNW